MKYWKAQFLKTIESYTDNIDWWLILGIFLDGFPSLLVMHHRIIFDDFADDSNGTVDVVNSFQWISSA